MTRRGLTKYDTERLFKKLRLRELTPIGGIGSGPPSGTGLGAVGSVSLTVSPAVSTDILDARISSTATFVQLQPLDTFAAAEVGAGNLRITTPADGTARIHHTASTQTRAFRYLLIFALAFLLVLSGAASAQQIQDDGTPLEVRPALNFTTNIACANDADSTDCTTSMATSRLLGRTTAGTGVAEEISVAAPLTLSGLTLDVTAIADADLSSSYSGVGACAANTFATTLNDNAGPTCTQPSTANLSDAADVMLEPNWSTGATYGLGEPYVDFAEVAISSARTQCIDVDDDTLCEFGGIAGISLFFDFDEDGAAELRINSSSVAFYSGGATSSSVTSGGDLSVSNIIKAPDGYWIGNATNVTLGNSSGIGREAATDRLFADRNVNFSTVQTRDTNTTGTERYLENDNEILRLTADYDNATTTGTEITGLQVSVNGARTYDTTYHLLVQSTSASFATTGVEFGVNYTNGTPAPFICKREVPTDDVVGAAATGLEEDVHVGGTTGKAYEYWVTQTEQTTAPDLGPTAGFLTQTATVMEEIHCIMTTASGAGDIEIYAAASLANNIRVKAGSWVNVITVP